MQTNKPFLPYHHTAGQSHVTFSWIMHINHRVQNFVHQHPHTWTTKSEPFTMHNPDLTHQEFIRNVGWRRKSLYETPLRERHIQDTSDNFREDTSDHWSKHVNSCRNFDNSVFNFDPRSNRLTFHDFDNSVLNSSCWLLDEDQDGTGKSQFDS